MAMIDSIRISDGCASWLNSFFLKKVKNINDQNQINDISDSC
jgi:hypothetical protein